MSHPRSFIAFLVSVATMLYCSFVFYPKWKLQYTEASISWDVAGYYWPLPATFIYHDPVQQRFTDSVVDKYTPYTGPAQTVEFDGKGNKIFRYTFGQTILFAPAFAIAHVLAKPFGFPADGFSLPYQLAIQISALLFAFLGLWYFRRLFLKYYSDNTVAVAIIILCIGSNYLNYSAIDNGLTHSSLFTLYVFLILSSISYYEKPGYKHSLKIGFLTGLIILTRPSEAICIMIPVLWGLNTLDFDTIKSRLRFLLNNGRTLLPAAAIAGLIVFIQPLYWKSVTGHWIMDTYSGQGFSFTRPHIWNYIWSYRSGWLVYTPIMILSFIGILPFLKYGKNTIAVLLFFFINLYIVASWDIWWYAGSGGRAMIQSYPILFFPIASLVTYIWKRPLMLVLFFTLCVAFTYQNIWFTYNAHGTGKLYDSEGMTKEYFWRVLGRWSAPPEVNKLKETNELFEGTPQKMALIYENNFEQDTSLPQSRLVIEGEKSYVMDKDHRSSGFITFPVPGSGAQWLRAQATYLCEWHEWERYKWSQLMVRFFNRGKVVKERMIYVDRYLQQGIPTDVYIDVKIPQEQVDSAGVSFWGEQITIPLFVDKLRVWTFEEK